jgi:hypothetical protein
MLVGDQANVSVIFTLGGAGYWPLNQELNPGTLNKPAVNLSDAINVLLFAGRSRCFSVAIVPQTIQNQSREVGMENPGSPQIALSFRAHTDRQVARASTAMLHFSICGDAKSLLRPLMCLHFWHIVVIPFELSRRCY